MQSFELNFMGRFDLPLPCAKSIFNFHPILSFLFSFPRKRKRNRHVEGKLAIIILFVHFVEKKMTISNPLRDNIRDSQLNRSFNCRQLARMEIFVSAAHHKRVRQVGTCARRVRKKKRKWKNYCEFGSVRMPNDRPHYCHVRHTGLKEIPIDDERMRCENGEKQKMTRFHIWRLNLLKSTKAVLLQRTGILMCVAQETGNIQASHRK